MRKLPLDSKTLIETLNAEFPHKCPHPAQSDREIWMYAGRRALIDYLLTVAETSKVRIGPAQLEEDEPEPEGEQ